MFKSEIHTYCILKASLQKHVKLLFFKSFCIYLLCNTNHFLMSLNIFFHTIFKKKKNHLYHFYMLSDASNASLLLYIKSCFCESVRYYWTKCGRSEKSFHIHNFIIALLYYQFTMFLKILKRLHTYTYIHFHKGNSP